MPGTLNSVEWVVRQDKWSGRQSIKNKVGLFRDVRQPRYHGLRRTKTRDPSAPIVNQRCPVVYSRHILRDTGVRPQRVGVLRIVTLCKHIAQRSNASPVRGGLMVSQCHSSGFKLTKISDGSPRAEAQRPFTDDCLSAMLKRQVFVERESPQHIDTGTGGNKQPPVVR